MNKTRVEAFSDAVIAIIMTIMILEIKTPQVGVLAGLIENIPYFYRLLSVLFYLYRMVQSSLHNVRNSLVF